ncbi:MAG TPA: slipin family protein [Methanothrix sp.]|jgi:regulator of protease activity HflC (stomatin/prohibitin superfamily)|nr:slipin family protein [Methanothrix sp.]HOV82793.1 slipin family protein [Methanothrix sp.]HPC89817.1 slipin family protein [Methanothrix sp.]HQE87540.1 slipin family protein [Methanothrix sp.]HQI68149.1 slipin family protein [Methanothrix sp.]
MVSITLLAGSALVALLLASSIQVVRQYERAVIFRLGKLKKERGPGLFALIPLMDKMVRVDMRVRELDVPKQTVISSDNVTLEVDAVIYYKVMEASRAIIEVEDFEAATLLLAQTTLRDILGQNELDTVLSDRENLNRRIKEILDSTTEPWGMHVVMVTMRDVSLPENMLRAIARQAEAEREKRARIILAEGEYQASKMMNEAADMYEDKPSAIKLREFQTLTEIAKEKNLIVVSTGSDDGHKNSDLPLFIGLARAAAGNK